MRYRNFKNVNEAYTGVIKDVWENPEFRCAPRGQNIREVLDYGFVVENPTSNPIQTLDEKRNKIIAEYTAKEVELYNSKTNKVKDFAKASKFWNRIANPDGTVNSAYGHLIFFKRSVGSMAFEKRMRTPWEWCVQMLSNDKHTRQAILKFNLAEHCWVGTKDFPCTIYGNFHIRNDKLFFSVKMRSNDLMKGLVYDMPWFISLMDKMIEELKPTYPNLTKGSYTHIADSMHIYEKDENTIAGMLGADNEA